jgi:hypothetical protein
MRHVTVFLDDARRAVLPSHAVWVVDVELETDGTVTQETWRRVDSQAVRRPFSLIRDNDDDSMWQVAIG